VKIQPNKVYYVVTFNISFAVVHRGQPMNSYFHHRFIGSQLEELIKLLLTESGYQVYDYGYERNLPAICEKYKTKGIKSTSTFLRIRHSPDFLVYNDKTHELKLVEIKMRTVNSDKNIYIDNYRMKNYQEFWKDAILVIAVNEGYIFYAQKIEEIALSKGWYNLSDHFQKIEDIFTRIEKEKLLEYKTKAIQILNSNQQENNDKSKTTTPFSNPEKPKKPAQMLSNNDDGPPYHCSECGKRISYRVHAYSMRVFDKSLCYGCQPVKEKTISALPSKPELRESVGIEIGGNVPTRKPVYDGY
jgi:hypothetical protein